MWCKCFSFQIAFNKLFKLYIELKIYEYIKMENTTKTSIKYEGPDDMKVKNI